jgi:hypothetical protein
MSNFDRAEMKHDLDKAVFYYDEDELCLRCDEQESLPGEDLCESCADIVRERNRDKFKAEETW